MEEIRAGNSAFPERGDFMNTLSIAGTTIAILGFSFAAPAQAEHAKTSGIYLTASDYKERRLSFEGDCRSRVHKLELHDVLNKPYIDVTHESEKHRFAKSDVFGFRACDGRDYRFAENLEYQILEARELYVYARAVSESRGKRIDTILKHYFSAGPDGRVLALTLMNLKQAFPENHKFHDSLDAAFGAEQPLAEYDEFHRMFKINRLLIASREP